MQSVQRQFGKLRSKGPGDNAKVSVLLNDYEDADKVLAKVIDGTKAWRESWLSLVLSQLAIVTEFYTLYDPIVGASDGHGRDTVPTPDLQLNRTFKLRQAYEDLKTELMDEIGQIEAMIIRPATEARDCIAPIRKTIKKRENKRLDLERCQDKVNKLQRKVSRTPKEESALGKAEDELAQLSNDFSIADTHLRETLPPIIAAAFSLVPPLLGDHVLIQNRLLGLYYTTLHNYCGELGFPSPSPPMGDVLADWEADFRPVQREVESIGCIARGKAVHLSMNLGLDGQPHQPATSPQSANPLSKMGFRRSTSGLISSNNDSNEVPQRQTLRIPSTSSTGRQDHSPQVSPSSTPRRPDYLAPTDFTTATVLGQSPAISPNSLRPRNDYFPDNRRPSTTSLRSNMSQLSLTPTNGSSSASAAAAAKKKKPPPPPPLKRVPSAQPEEYVVALYSFSGQGAGDLSFREGDRIKIVKKTDTAQDWWVGEIAGARGNFPANYCKPI
ncbi:SH3 domain signaling protein [Coniochaeta sp. 2T2.1]|nr:SH3 domain signaling protein [Coniochaeta sp. 2T2.1]